MSMSVLNLKIKKNNKLLRQSSASKSRKNSLVRVVLLLASYDRTTRLFFLAPLSVVQFDSLTSLF